MLAVLSRRGQVFLRRARLLPFVLLLYVLYALAPLYMPSFAPSSLSSTGNIRYIVSSPSALSDRLPLKNLDVKFTPSFYSTEEFQKYLLKEVNTWPSDYRSYKRIIGLRIPSYDKIECYTPSPALSNILTSCLPIFTLFSNQTMTPLNFISNDQGKRTPEFQDFPVLKEGALFYCLYTLPPTLHMSIVLLSLSLIICAAFMIQDYTSGFHSYSRIHGMSSPIYWIITYLSDLILCLLWLLLLILIARFVHSSTFNGRFFALTPLFFIVNLPFIYLLAKFFTAPILGATTILIILQFAHVLYTFRVLIEVFRSYRTISIIIHVLRWSLLLIFPNVNVFTLIVAILRPYSCPIDDSSGQEEGFAHERYSNKILIHTLIFIIQIILYFILLIIIDTCKLPTIGRSIKGRINQAEEDDDVTEERQRIETMNNQEKQEKSLIVNNLSKRYFGSNIPAVNRLTFSVPHRQCFGLLGFNGSGMFNK
jgi:ABC-type multidrug transport system fused ATPase/permease subunit